MGTRHRFESKRVEVCKILRWSWKKEPRSFWAKLFWVRMSNDPGSSWKLATTNFGSVVQSKNFSWTECSWREEDADGWLHAACHEKVWIDRHTPSAQGFCVFRGLATPLCDTRFVHFLFAAQTRLIDETRSSSRGSKLRLKAGQHRLRTRASKQDLCFWSLSFVLVRPDPHKKRLNLGSCFCVI